MQKQIVNSVSVKAWVWSSISAAHEHFGFLTASWMNILSYMILFRILMYTNPSLLHVFLFFHRVGFFIYSTILFVCFLLQRKLLLGFEIQEYGGSYLVN